MRVRTFYDDDTEDGDLVTYPRSQLVKVKLDNGKTVTRHFNRVEALDEEAVQAIALLKETLK